ncbi:MAG: HigA family addiction module antitoxin [Gammaproteobacteria bacterium]|nr:HigA family addiction module antitoxin [Gammaproteobacteria bacterium]
MDIGFDVEHPGIVLWEEYLQPLGISQSRFARDVHISYPRANELLNGKRALTPDTALRLASYLGTSAEFWINWQGLYDLQQTIKRHKEEYQRIERVA